MGANWASGLDAVKTFGKSMEEKMQANSAQFQQQEKLNASKHGLGGSKHGIGGSKHGLGGSLMSRLQVGLNKVEESSTPAKESNNTTADPFPGPDTPFHTPAKDSEDAAATPFATPAESTDATTTPTAKATPLLSTRSPDDVSKEELMEVLKKMNTRVKALSTSRAQLTEKVQKAERDKLRLINLVKNEIVGEADYNEAFQKMEKLTNQSNAANNAEATPDEVMILQSAWRTADERNQLNIQQLSNEYRVMTMQAQAEVEKVRKSVMEEKVRIDYVLSILCCRFI